MDNIWSGFGTPRDNQDSPGMIITTVSELRQEIIAFIERKDFLKMCNSDDHTAKSSLEEELENTYKTILEKQERLIKILEAHQKE